MTDFPNPDHDPNELPDEEPIPLNEAGLVLHRQGIRHIDDPERQIWFLDNSTDSIPCSVCGAPAQFLIGHPRNGVDSATPFCLAHVAHPPNAKTGDFIGRMIFGLLALICAAAFGAAAVGIFMANPQGLGRQVLKHIMMDAFILLSLFMALATMHFWGIAKRFTQVTIKRIQNRAVLVLLCFVAFILTIAIIKR